MERFYVVENTCPKELTAYDLVRGKFYVGSEDLVDVLARLRELEGERHVSKTVR